MQHSYDQYKNYNSSGFILDDDFINWIINPDSKSDAYWNGFLAENPTQAKNIGKAKKVILSFQQKKEKAPEAVKDSVWQSVLSRTQMPKVMIMRKSRVWMAAAAAIFVLVLGGTAWYFFNNAAESASPVIAKKEVKNDVAPGGNKATLTLSDGSNIILDSAQNGLLTRQGNAHVMITENGKLVYQKQTGEPVAVQYNTITTPRGGQYQLTLADGSQVWLNAASSITFPTAFTGDKREVKITGETYFEVAHNANMPFHVSVDGMDVQVLGTHFNINSYSDEPAVKTTLLEGSVKVSKGLSNILIKPGEQAVLPGNANNIVVKQNVDMDEVIAWKNKKFVFQDLDLKSIMRQVARWYNIDVSYIGNISNDEYVGIISRDVNISEILKMLETSSDLKFEIIGKNVIVKN